jgi:SOS response regulatory protein OraA/RecX
LDLRREDGTVHVLLEGGRALEIAAPSLPAGLPPVGEVVSASLVAELEQAAERKRVARRIFAMLDRRLQPVARIRRKLTEQGYAVEAVDRVLDQMKDQGLYDDRRYAEAFCRDCLLNRAVGRRYLVAKLREKQVPGPVAAAAADAALDPDTERELADQAARARWGRERDPRAPKSLAKVVRYLQGRGFDAGTANRAARAARPAPESAPED